MQSRILSHSRTISQDHSNTLLLGCQIWRSKKKNTQNRLLCLCTKSRLAAKGRDQGANGASKETFLLLQARFFCVRVRVRVCVCQTGKDGRIYLEFRIMQISLVILSVGSPESYAAWNGQATRAEPTSTSASQQIQTGTKVLGRQVDKLQGQRHRAKFHIIFKSLEQSNSVRHG